MASLKRPPLADRKRLLIVDDELPILKLVTRILATDNYEITSAQSGDAAAELVAAPDFPGVDLLVTDLMMPGMNGRELGDDRAPAISEGRASCTSPASPTRLFQDLQELGEGESFIEKPFGTDGLLEATRLLMFGHISDGAGAARSARRWERVGGRSPAREGRPAAAPLAHGLGRRRHRKRRRFSAASRRSKWPVTCA